MPSVELRNILVRNDSHGGYARCQVHLEPSDMDHKIHSCMDGLKPCALHACLCALPLPATAVSGRRDTRRKPTPVKPSFTQQASVQSEAHLRLLKGTMRERILVASGRTRGVRWIVLMVVSLGGWRPEGRSGVHAAHISEVRLLFRSWPRDQPLSSES
jgi:hypothetical protein